MRAFTNQTALSEFQIYLRIQTPSHQFALIFNILALKKGHFSLSFLKKDTGAALRHIPDD